MSRPSLLSSSLAVAILSVLGASSSLGAPPTFQGLGHRVDEIGDNAAFGVSADGRVVVGYWTPADGVTAFRWTASTGLVSLGLIADGDINSRSWAASADGGVVVGDGAKLRGHDCFRWDIQRGMVSLGNLRNTERFFSNGYAYDVSDDGSVVVGVSDNVDFNGEAFRWTHSRGMVGLGDLDGGQFYSTAYGVSADGLTVVGQGSRLDFREAFRWTEADGMVGLGNFAFGLDSLAAAASGDGSVVVGWGLLPNDDPNDPFESHAFRWTAASGMIDLGDLRGGRLYSLANSISADGEVIVGQATSDGAPESGGLEAFVWTRRTGVRSVQSILAASGLDLTGWTLVSATGVSADGQTIVGFGIHGDGSMGGPGEGWIATLPRPCPGDFNFSGGPPTVQDIFDYLAAYFAPERSADVNLSGDISVQDIFDFLAMYFAVC